MITNFINSTIIVTIAIIFVLENTLNTETNLVKTGKKRLSSFSCKEKLNENYNQRP